MYFWHGPKVRKGLVAAKLPPQIAYPHLAAATSHRTARFELFTKFKRSEILKDYLNDSEAALNWLLTD
ncbi:hypothetical protein A8938_2728 [Algoriphagus zhangzhouensis]|uniref:Uncharacterized protein n=1 Tax=Algoriphagus zhangzhouensis TaxID=1073327 RepID=A0A1M7ZER3_9BACT|nr:hypothetical protein A8938_2728 [Algoriphagus zhangzhouensis]SHO63395.1 hypothetical protein SAMN04488108_2725 [Algoriphagus zhangzhouensis]